MTEHHALDARCTELETRLMFQEDTLRQLNDALTDQHARVQDLERLCRHLIERVSRLGESVDKGSAAEEIPPHY